MLRKPAWLALSILATAPAFATGSGSRVSEIGSLFVPAPSPSAVFDRMKSSIDGALWVSWQEADRERFTVQRVRGSSSVSWGPFDELHPPLLAGSGAWLISRTGGDRPWRLHLALPEIAEPIAVADFAAPPQLLTDSLHRVLVLDGAGRQLIIYSPQGIQLGAVTALEPDCSEYELRAFLGQFAVVLCQDLPPVLESYDLEGGGRLAARATEQLIGPGQLLGLFPVEASRAGTPLAMELRVISWEIPAEGNGLSSSWPIVLHRFDARLEPRGARRQLLESERYTYYDFASGDHDGGFRLGRREAAIQPCSGIGPGRLLHFGPEGELRAAGGYRKGSVRLPDGRWLSMPWASGVCFVGARMTLVDPITGEVAELLGGPTPAGDVDAKTARVVDDRLRLWRPAVSQEGPGIRATDYALLSERCVETANRRCLGRGRYELAASWRDPAFGHRGRARMQPLSDDSLYATFFRPGNIELTVKILDGWTYNRHDWLFYAGLTTLDLQLSVRDLLTGRWRVLEHASGAPNSFADVRAFDGRPPDDPALETVPPLDGIEPPPEGAFEPAGETLVLHDFELTVDWRVPETATEVAYGGTGQALTFSADSGFFWFFREGNLELIVKLLDGTPLNGHYWLFVGAKTDVEYTLSIRCSTSPDCPTRSWSNRAGELRSFVDLEAYPQLP